jgi:hypothetical protein
MELQIINLLRAPSYSPVRGVYMYLAGPGHYCRLMILELLAGHIRRFENSVDYEVCLQ